MTVTLATSTVDPPAALGRPLWLGLWNGDGTPVTAQWSDLVGPPGNANGDTYPTSPGARSHPAPLVVSVEDSREVVVLRTAAMLVGADALRDGFVTRWFAPGTINVAAAQRPDGTTRSGSLSATHTTLPGVSPSSVAGCTRVASTASAAGVGALVLYRDGASWRPAIVKAVA